MQGTSQFTNTRIKSTLNIFAPTIAYSTSFLQDVLTEEFIVGALPTKNQVLSIIQITRLLSSKATDSLCTFDILYAADPRALKAMNE